MISLALREEVLLEFSSDVVAIVTLGFEALGDVLQDATDPPRGLEGDGRGPVELGRSPVHLGQGEGFRREFLAGRVLAVGAEHDRAGDPHARWVCDGPFSGRIGESGYRRRACLRPFAKFGRVCFEADFRNRDLRPQRADPYWVGSD